MPSASRKRLISSLLTTTPRDPKGTNPVAVAGRLLMVWVLHLGQRLAQQTRDYFAQTRVFGAGDFFGGNQGIVFKINGGAHDMPPAFSWE